MSFELNDQIIKWLDEHFEELEELFLATDSFVNFGFLIVCARV